jgi:hypothetical protein
MPQNRHTLRRGNRLVASLRKGCCLTFKLLGCLSCQIRVPIHRRLLRSKAFGGPAPSSRCGHGRLVDTRTISDHLSSSTGTIGPECERRHLPPARADDGKSRLCERSRALPCRQALPAGPTVGSRSRATVLNGYDLADSRQCGRRSPVSRATTSISAGTFLPTGVGRPEVRCKDIGQTLATTPGLTRAAGTSSAVLTFLNGARTSSR